MADSVGDVAEQELLPTCHSRVADNEDVDRLLLGRANDRHRRIIIYDDKRTATLTGELPGVYGKLLAGCDRSGAFGGSVLGDGWALRYDYLHDDQFGAAAIGQRSSPSDRLVRRFGPIGPHHHTPHHLVLHISFHALTLILLASRKRESKEKYHRALCPARRSVLGFLGHRLGDHAVDGQPCMLELHCKFVSEELL